MESGKLHRAIQGLKWEANYRKLSKGESTGGSFLTEVKDLDEDFARTLRDRNLEGKSLLDIGTGIGWQAIQLAKLGFKVTATDVSSLSLAQAAQNAAAQEVTIRFVPDNILHTSLPDTYDIVVDRGCFTILIDEFLADYVTSVYKLIRGDGYFFLKIDFKKEKRLELLTEKFRLEQKIESDYLGPKGKPIKAIFVCFVL